MTHLDLQQRLEQAEAERDALQQQVNVLEAKHKVEMDGANDRSKLLFDAKNHWADRARAAEAELERLKAQTLTATLPAQICTRQAIDRLEREEAPGSVNVAYKWGYNQAIADAKSLEPRPAAAVPVNKEKIRDVFMRNGFTVKEGQDDLKQYVYDAAYELLRLNAGAEVKS